MGLAVCLGIAIKVGGMIEVSNRENTKFMVYLSLSKSIVETKKENFKIDNLKSKEFTNLVIEDQHTI